MHQDEELEAHRAENAALHALCKDFERRLAAQEALGFQELASCAENAFEGVVGERMRTSNRLELSTLKISHWTLAITK